METGLGGIRDFLFSVGESIGLLKNDLATLPHKHAAGEIVALNIWLEVCVDGSCVGGVGSRNCTFALASQKHDANRAGNEPQSLFAGQRSHL